MFVGHTALALAAKRKAPRVSLGVLLAAAVWLDLVWPLFLFLGVEQVRIDPGNTAFTPLDFTSYPWTHSLVLVIGWSIAFAVVARVLLRGHSAPVLLGLLVFSHWALDLVTHRPDLPLWPGNSPKLGLGLWNSIPGTLVVEGALFVAGIVIYTRTTRARDAVGRFAFWALIIVYTVIWFANLGSAPPPSSAAIAWVGLAAWLFPLWAWWADRHRAVVTLGR